MHAEHEPEVRALHAAQTSDVIDVLCDAFFDYPVMRFTLGDVDYARRLPILINLFVMGRVLRRDPIFGIADGTRLIAAVTTSTPHGEAAPPELHGIREDTWARLGTEARTRYEAAAAVWDALEPDVPRRHINMIGVRRSHHGRGHGRRMLDHVHAMADADPHAEGISLSTENPANVRLYEHFGYRVIGTRPVSDDMHTWVLFRSRC